MHCSDISGFLATTANREAILNKVVHCVSIQYGSATFSTGRGHDIRQNGYKRAQKKPQLSDLLQIVLTYLKFESIKLNYI